MAETNNNESKVFPLPYPMMVEGETAVRPKEDFWRFRIFTSVLRQSPNKIQEFAERYKK